MIPTGLTADFWPCINWFLFFLVYFSLFSMFVKCNRLSWLPIIFNVHYTSSLLYLYHIDDILLFVYVVISVDSCCFQSSCFCLDWLMSFAAVLQTLSTVSAYHQQLIPANHTLEPPLSSIHKQVSHILQFWYHWLWCFSTR